MKIHAGQKKLRELEIVRMVYSETDNPTKQDHEENPDFLLQDITRRFFIGIEVTELYRTESSARLKNIDGYLDELISDGQYRHRDDFSELIVDDFDLLGEDGQVKYSVRGVMQKIPPLPDHLQLLENCIRQKGSKLHHYSCDAKFHNLIIYENENYFGLIKVEDFYVSFYSNAIIASLHESGFREIYFIGKIDTEIRFVPLKGYLLYAFAVQFEYFYQESIGIEISVEDYGKLFISVLAKVGFAKAKVHGDESFIIVSYGDFSIRIDFLNKSKNLLVINTNFDYSDGEDVSTYAARMEIDQSIPDQFTSYQKQHTFHTDIAFPIKHKST